MKKVKKYKAIQYALRMEGYNNQDIAERINRCKEYVASHFRMDSGKTFCLTEAYTMLDMAGIPRERIFEFFPPDGEGAPALTFSERRETVV